MRATLSPAATQQTTQIIDNLRVTDNGSLWADYELSGVEYAYQSFDKKVQAREDHKNLTKVLPDDALLLSVIAHTNPDDIVAAASRKVDLDRRPEYRDEIEGKRAYFRDNPSRPRKYFLSVPVAAAPPEGDASGLGAEDWARRVAEARSVAADTVRSIPDRFKPKPVTARQMVWLWDRALARGCPADPYPSSEASPITPKAAGFTRAWVHEKAEYKKKGLRKASGGTTQNLRVERAAATHEDDSWQIMLTVASYPIEGLPFPGSELFAVVERLSHLDVDWAIRLSSSTREEVIERNKKMLERFGDQIVERGDDDTFGVSHLHEQVGLLAEYTSILEAEEGERETQFTPIFAVAARTEADAEHAATRLAQEYDALRVKLVAPIHAQRDLWSAMNPGAQSPKAVDDYAQIAPSADFAGTVPIISSELGDGHGPILGVHLSSGRATPVHFDLLGTSGRDVSPSLEVSGELGSGKSYTIKTIALHVVDLGGQFFCIDRTGVGEYEHFAKALDTGAVVIDPIKPKYSLDPLRLFPTISGVDKALDLLLPLLNLASDDPAALTLSELLSPTRVDDLGSASRIGSLHQLVAHMQTELDKGSTLTGLGELHRSLKYWSGREYAQALFAPDLPVLDLTVPGIVARTNSLELPVREELDNPTLFRQLSPIKRFGRAFYGFSANLVKSAFFNGENSRFGMFIVDEAYHLLETREGGAVVKLMIKDGRKNNAGVVLGTHNPEEDYGQGGGTNLIPTRIAHRHKDRALAAASLRRLDIDPVENPHILAALRDNTSPREEGDRVPEHRRGEGYMRDASGRVGRIRVLGPSSHARREALNTTPTDMGAAA